MIATDEKIQWVSAISADDVPQDGGNCVKVGAEQIAIFNFASKNEWYATSNLCPHKFQMILSRGMIGDKNGEPKVSCPYHKKSFSLKSGECLTDEGYNIKTYPVKVENGQVFIGIV